MQEKKLHIVYWKNRPAVCPKCGGLITTMKSDEIILHCIDCNTYFRAIGFGNADAEIECEEVLLSMRYVKGDKDGNESI